MGRTDKTDALYVFERNMDVDVETGLLISVPGCAVNRLPYPVRKGDKIRPAAGGIRLKVFFYLPEIPDELIHTYTYQPESNWTTYCPECSNHEWSEAEHTICEDGFIRVAAAPPGESPAWADTVFVEKAEPAPSPIPDWMAKETEDLCRRVEAGRQSGDLVLLLLADTHNAVGCTWPDTLQSLRLTADRLHPDAAVHLGDLTDGLLPTYYTRLLTDLVLEELRGVCGQLWCCVGNHDRNRFRGNPKGISREECAERILRQKAPWYKVKLPEKKLMLLFLDSFDPDEKERYGFSAEEVRWVRRTLRFVPRGYRVLIFSHVPPLAEIHVWSDTIRNEKRMLRCVQRFHARRNGAVLAWIHGHSHADQVYEKLPFPVIGIGCAKLEDFREHKPEGSVTWERIRGTASQELWDVLLIHAGEGSLDFFRFGAGQDRHVSRKKNP